MVSPTAELTDLGSDDESYQGPFQSVAELFAPADPRVPTVILEADDGWSYDTNQLSDQDAIVWGRLQGINRGALSLLAFAARREAALARLQGRLGRQCVVHGLHRLAARSEAGRMRRGLKSALLGGVIAEAAPEEPPVRRIDLLMAEAAGTRSLDQHRLFAGRDGSLLVGVADRAGVPCELRIARVAGSNGIARAGEALRRLEEMHIPRVPRLRASGSTLGRAWCLESHLSGMAAASVKQQLVDDMVDFLASLVVRDASPEAPLVHLRYLAEKYPDRAVALAQVEQRVADVTGSWPAVVQHGDLYRDNLLVAAGALTGVIDWETWHPRGTPGVDMVHLLMLGAADGGSRLTDVASPERWPAATRQAVDRCLRTLGVAVGPTQLTAVGVACWANRLAVLLQRPERRRIVGDRAWITRHVDAVLKEVSL